MLIEAASRGERAALGASQVRALAELGFAASDWDAAAWEVLAAWREWVLEIPDSGSDA
ncbi:MAG: hypothetical protein HOP12_03805 [Candidatus Eisenbacteria bacterium]|uniref:Uncharacterized protein n=1 Tax=Eiseniibacteriota bacterium TaxID=2212470 RepID=A0A849SFM7_UNCEI|nr:hypothetical protein [Candidatus Eisenbacteria bacterium]